MRTKLFLFFLFLSYFFIATFSKVHALDPFVKHPNNPLVFSGSYTNWNEQGKYQPSVLFDDGVYKMWYASYNGSQFKIAYATSPDGITWSKQNRLDLRPGFDNHDPSILKTTNGYVMFFVSSTNGSSQNFKIYKISSTDGVNYDPQTISLVLQPEGLLERNAVSSPFVFHKNDSYYLFYLCWGNLGLRICMAISPDGDNWTRCPNNPIISETSDGPTVLEKGGKIYLFYQSSPGLRFVESPESLSCSMTWTSPQTILPEPLVGPSIFEKDGQLLLYYMGFNPTPLEIYFATSGVASSPTPTLTPSPTLTPTSTPTPTSTLTPTPAEKKKIILIPGLMASWNKDAMLHNQQVDQQDWHLLPFVQEYKGITETLKNIGYQQDDDFYIFSYDWRRGIEQLADELAQFILAKNLDNKKINLVGHSLGGLISRIYGQKIGTQNIEKIITAGSPHQGTAKAYPLVEAGEIERDNTLIWLMQKLFFQINKNTFQTDKEAIQALMPSAKDLFPIYDFLNDGSSYIPVDSLQTKNATLKSFSSNFSDIFDSLITIAGTNSNMTLFGYRVTSQNALDILLKNYVDGRPAENIYDLGDKTILSSSALVGNNKASLAADHAEIIYAFDSIKTILNKLGISYEDSQIVEGSKTNITPSLIFAILSPAEIEVSHNGQIFNEYEGLIFISNAEQGDYQLDVKGKSPGGKYKVLVGQIGNDQDKWFEIVGEINSILPFLQTDIYMISFDPNNPLDYSVNQNDTSSLFDLLIKKYSEIKKEYNHSDLGEAIEEIQDAKKNFQKKKYANMRKQILHSLEEVFNARKKASTYYKNELYDALIQLENLYQKTSEATNYSPKKKDLEKKLADLKKKYAEYESYLLKQNQKKKDVLKQSVSFLHMKEKLDQAEKEINKNTYALAEVLLVSATKLGQEIR